MLEMAGRLSLYPLSLLPFLFFSAQRLAISCTESSLETQGLRGPGAGAPPVILVKWYDFTRWPLERIDGFSQNQRFVFGTRLADHALDTMETLVEAANTDQKVQLLTRANRRIEMLRWLVHLAKDRNVLTEKQYLFACQRLAECGPRLQLRHVRPCVPRRRR
jgi:hypothetical protein